MFTIMSTIGGIFVFELGTEVGSVMQVIGFLTVGTTLVAYLFAALKNPGISSSGDIEQPLLAQPYCATCRFYRAEGTVHCDVCDLCIRRRDHHCPWVGKCVGEGNLIPFNIFLLGILGCIFYMLICGSVKKTDSSNGRQKS
jgi:hypothetical protein